MSSEEAVAAPPAAQDRVADDAAAPEAATEWRTVAAPGDGALAERAIPDENVAPSDVPQGNAPQFEALRRAPNLVKLEESPLSKGVKLSVRKLSFDSHVSKMQAAKRKEEASAAAGSSSGAAASASEGLPSLLKRLRQDAQAEIDRATAASRYVHICLAREIRLLELSECAMRDAHTARVAALEAAHAQQVDALRAEIATLTADGETLRAEKRAVEEARAASEQRNAELTAEVTTQREAARLAAERADAMEAASALLQSEDVDCAPTRAQPAARRTRSCTRRPLCDACHVAPAC